MVKKKEKKEAEKTAESSENFDSAIPTLQIVAERDIALDFATKVYSTFDQMIKSIVLFGSSAKKISTPDSDIDIIIIIDDVSIAWDEVLIAHYRESLAELVKENPYRKSLHINTVKLSTWWADLMRGDPVVINVLRYGDTLIDRGGFFNPLKVLLKEGKIKSTPESIYTLLQRSPTHLSRARESMLIAVDGFYWSAVDAAHAALIAAGVMPPSPEHIPEIMDEEFVKKKMLNKKYVNYYYGLYNLTKEITHGKVRNIAGKELERLQSESDDFLREMAKLVDKLIEKRY
jgi:predicted nucleotidyltransferase/uncharacterized protein (UPF0332 family)